MDSDSDVSSLRKPISCGTSDAMQIWNCLKTGTQEARNVLLHECKIVLECKVCNSLFRGLPNILAHKRAYCTKSCGMTPLLMGDVNAELETVFLEPTDPDVDKFSTTPTQFYGNVISRLDSRLKREARIQLSRIDVNPNAVFQKISLPDGSHNVITVVEPKPDDDSFFIKSIPTPASSAIGNETKCDSTWTSLTESEIKRKSDSTSQSKGGLQVGTPRTANHNGKTNNRAQHLFYRKTFSRISFCDMKGLRCKKCDISYQSFGSLRKHMMRKHVGNHTAKHRDTVSKTISCPKCQKLFLKVWNVTRHMLQVHKSSRKEIEVFRKKCYGHGLDHRGESSGENGINVVELKTNSDDSVVLLCEKQVLKNVEVSLEKAVEVFKTTKSVKLAESESNDIAAEAGVIQNKFPSVRTFSCPLPKCDATFNVKPYSVTRHLLKVHCLTENQAKSYRSKILKSVTYSPVMTKKEHNRNLDINTANELPVDETPKQLTDAESMQRNTSHFDGKVRFMSGFTLLKCSCCNKVFGKKEVYDRHRMNCDGEISFKAEQRFSPPASGNLTECEHSQLQGDGLNEATDSLNEATENISDNDFSASQIGSMQKFEEHLYNLRFSNQHKLSDERTDELNKIIDESACKCLFCDMQFSNVSGLHRHAVRHMGWKRFKCAMCAYMAFNRSDVKTHLRRVHPAKTAGLVDLNKFIVNLNEENEKTGDDSCYVESDLNNSQVDSNASQDGSSSNSKEPGISHAHRRVAESTSANQIRTSPRNAPGTSINNGSNTDYNISTRRNQRTFDLRPCRSSSLPPRSNRSSNNPGTHNTLDRKRSLPGSDDSDRPTKVKIIE